MGVEFPEPFEIPERDDYDAELKNFILAQSKDGDTFWDVGAHIGLVTRVVRVQNPRGHVVAVECNPYTASHLARLIVGPATVVVAALWDIPGKPLELTLYPDNAGITKVGETRHEFDHPGGSVKSCVYDTKVLVATTTMDKLLEAGLPQPNFLKIDTEGADLDILRGGYNVLRNPALKAVVTERDQSLLGMFGHSVEELDNLMSSLGFSRAESEDNNGYYLR